MGIKKKMFAMFLQVFCRISVLSVVCLSAALRYTSTENEHKDSAARLTNHLVNIRCVKADVSKAIHELKFDLWALRDRWFTCVGHWPITKKAKKFKNSEHLKAANICAYIQIGWRGRQRGGGM